MAQRRTFPWRFIFTDLGSVTTTWADGLLTARKLTYTLDAPSTIEAAVWPDDRRVNEIFPADGLPLVAQSKRLIYGLRRDNPDLVDGLPAWTCRAAGILMSPEDEGGPDVPLTHILAYDPWTFLDARPVQLLDGGLGGPQGINWYAVTPDTIALELLVWTIANNPAVGGIGNGTFIDAGDGSRIAEGPQYGDNGGTPFYQGTLEAFPTTSQITFTTGQGMSIADAWSQLCATGLIDIVLTPIFDQADRPGYTHELSIYNRVGTYRPGVRFGWDMLGRNAKKIDRAHDGTPGNFFNTVQYFAGPGGFPVPLNGLTDAPSVAAFGNWWAQQFVANQSIVGPLGGDASTLVLRMAQQALVMAKQGKRTITLDLIPDRSPLPLIDYFVGDFVDVRTTARLRVKTGATVTGDDAFRIQTIPIDVTDDGVETVSSLVVSPDFTPIGGLTGKQDQIETKTVAVIEPSRGRSPVRSRLSPP